jgi:hypothetical protein
VTRVWPVCSTLYFTQFLAAFCSTSPASLQVLGEQSLACLQLRRLQTVKHDSEERRKEGLCHCFRDESGKTMQELGVAKHWKQKAMGVSCVKALTNEHVLFLGPLLASSSLPFAWSVSIISKWHYFSSNIVIYILNSIVLV